MLAFEAQHVVWLRGVEFTKGGAAAQRKAARMVGEKATVGHCSLCVLKESACCSWSNSNDIAHRPSLCMAAVCSAIDFLSTEADVCSLYPPSCLLIFGSGRMSVEAPSRRKFAM